MQERIFEYLKGTGRPLPADRILREVLNTRSANPAAADRVLQGLLMDDSRFLRLDNGLWTISAEREQEQPGLMGRVAILHLRWMQPSRTQIAQGALFVPQTGRLTEFSNCLPRWSPKQRALLGEARAAAEGRVLVLWSAKELRCWNLLLHGQGFDSWNGRTLQLSRFSSSVLAGIPRGMPPEDLAPRVQLPPPDPGETPRMAKYFAECLEELLNRVPAEFRLDWESIRRWMQRGRKKDFRKFAFGEAFLESLPNSPGVYMMLDRAGEIFYVGKARNLKMRIRSYFSPSAQLDPRVARIREHLHSLDYVLTPSEVEALLLEMRMIRDFRPALNLQSEVHERRETYGKYNNLLLVVPGADGRKARVYFLRNGSFRGQQTVLLDRTPPSRLRKKIRSTYFSGSTGKTRNRQAWEMELVSSWLASNRRRLNFIDIDEAGDYESVCRQLGNLLREKDLAAGRIYHR